MNNINWFIHGEEKASTYKYEDAFVDIKRILDYISKTFDEDLSVSIHICDSNRIKELNNEHRGKDSSTDVLSFPHMEIEEGFLYIGDIFINEDIIESQSKEIESDPLTEIKFLSMHGMLHLIGYDHITEEDEEKMTSMQREIFTNLKIRNDKDGISI